MKIQHYCILLALLCTLSVSSADAQGPYKRFEAADSDGVTASRDQTSLYLNIDAEVTGPVKVPRLAAPIRSMVWIGSDKDHGITLKPEPDHWVINWKSRPAGDATLLIEFDNEPLLMSEVKAIEAVGDGSFYLPAYLALTKGEKLRYEPQPYKNTVGFWVGKQDSAAWRFNVDKPGRLNIAILQGCGKGQGGSQATISFRYILDKESEQTLSFDVLETGHWQNFQWISVGTIELEDTGHVLLEVSPQEIKKAALMDIRAIHLIRLPDKK